MLGKRAPSYYRRLLGMPNVVMVSPFVSGLVLTQRATAVATITGTTGLEALMLGKPLLMIGETEYAHIRQGLVRCTDPVRMPLAMREVLALKPASDEALLRFIAASLAASLPMKNSDVWGRVTRQLIEERRDGLHALADGLVNAARHRLRGNELADFA